MKTTEMNTEKLLPCPFCGEQPEYQPAAKSVAHPQYGWEAMVNHQCKVLGLQVCVRGEKDVVKTWNTRSTPLPTPDLSEKVKEAAEDICRSLGYLIDGAGCLVIQQILLKHFTDKAT